ncbi:hypothetical protein OAX78_03825 [Planctomycetota bacterium]|nr:hypothetical protein [Planctomycetota bacterium]
MATHATKKHHKNRVNVLDTYLKGLERLSRLSSNVADLEEEVAGREAHALRQILGLLEPLLPRLEQDISIREPWLGGTASAKHYHVPGLVVSQSFQQLPDGDRINHEGHVLAILSGGRLAELKLTGAWREGPPVSDTSWRVETSECDITPEFARKHLSTVLSGVLNALRDAIVKGRDEREQLKKRLALLDEVDQLLRS